jgi:epoxyqueuosine reductase
MDLQHVTHQLKTRARALGFDDCRITDLQLHEAPQRLHTWLAQGMHGSMDYMQRHAHLRADPQALVPGVIRAVCVRINYLPANTTATASGWQAIEWARLRDPQAATVSLYARGRDYHKVVRTRLQLLADALTGLLPHRYRVFCDSAPVMEVELACKAGIGWRGKHTLVLNREAGSVFFLGELLTDCPLPVDEAQSDHCGSCSACIDVCPTRAIVAPYVVDARRCISYLTIEHAGSIPEALRPLMGNRIYGCDDCQLACPWNKFAKPTQDQDFAVRNGLDSASLSSLFAWSEEEFNARLQGSAIRRIGHARWLRNIAVALGNAARQGDAQAVQALHTRLHHTDAMVREHIQWAIAQYP